MADNIYKKMLMISGEISRVAKNLNVGIGKNQYKAVGEADVLAAVKPIEEKYGIYSFPIEREIADSGIMESESEYNGKVTKKIQQFIRLRIVYRFVNTENPEEYIDIPSYGDGVDSQDKAPGKAMTYADKYALLKAYKIITGEDPDQNYSEPLRDIKRETIGAVKAKALTRRLEAANVNIEALLLQNKVSKLEDLTEAQHLSIVRRLNEAENGNNGKS